MKEILDAIDNITHDCPGFTDVTIEVCTGKTMQYEIKVWALDPENATSFSLCVPFKTMKDGLKALDVCVRKTIFAYCEQDYL
jgi:hypothetical protein